MLISFLMTLASFMGLFMIHYHNTTVYQPQLLLTAPPIQKADPLLFTHVHVIPDDYLESIEDVDDIIDIDNSSYDDVEELTQEVLSSVNDSLNQPVELSPVIGAIPFVFIVTYITLLLCVQQRILVENHVPPSKKDGKSIGLRQM